MDLKEIIQHIKASLPTKKKYNPIKSSSQKQIIRPCDVSYEKELQLQKKVKEINSFEKRYSIIQKVSSLQLYNQTQKPIIQDEDEDEDEDEDDLLTRRELTSIPYLLITYSLSSNDYTWENFFSPLRENYEQSPKSYFHYYFQSYFYLVDSLLLLNQKNIYCLKIDEEIIFINSDNKLPMLFLPITFTLNSTFHPSDITKYIIHLSEEDKNNLPPNFSLEEKEEELQNNLSTLSNYQLSRLYLQELDKISYTQIHNKKYETLRKQVVTCFQKVLDSPKETLEQTKNKILSLFL
jgi:hypothetical protein